YKSMKLEVNITKTRFFSILGLILILAGAIATYAYTTTFDRPAAQATTFGHSADETVVKMADGSFKTVQELLAGGVSGGSGGPIVVKNCQRFYSGGDCKSVNACPADYPLLTGIEEWDNDVETTWKYCASFLHCCQVGYPDVALNIAGTSCKITPNTQVAGQPVSYTVKGIATGGNGLYTYVLRTPVFDQRAEYFFYQGDSDLPISPSSTGTTYEDAPGLNDWVYDSTHPPTTATVRVTSGSQTLSVACTY
ncbi:MAG: hypothetical protein Q8Q31_02690, partial [Nanoarchaeota archaeon]|nr:hypothetical protein [Nanoarchaeota archaeon]